MARGILGRETRLRHSDRLRVFSAVRPPIFGNATRFEQSNKLSVCRVASYPMERGNSWSFVHPSKYNSSKAASMPIVSGSAARLTHPFK